jgi:RNA polymerase sigma-70 factor (ECF subfamily)
MGASLSRVRQPDELDFASRCISGDRGALRALFERERRAVHATLFRLVGSNAQIDDLLQEVFLEVFRSLPTFRGEASLRTWIDRCTVRVAYAHFRRKRSRGVQLELMPDIAAGDATAEDRAVMREAARRLYVELDRLEPAQRMAFTLQAIEGHSLQEVARLMQASLVATKTRVWRARRALENRAKRDPLLAEFLGAEVEAKGDTSRCDPK